MSELRRPVPCHGADRLAFPAELNAHGLATCGSTAYRELEAAISFAESVLRQVDEQEMK